MTSNLVLNNDNKDLLITLFNAGVNAVAGFNATQSALTAKPYPFNSQAVALPDLIIAVGKAASGMCEGALAATGNPCPALVVTKYQHSTPALRNNPLITVIESAHPVPDENSLLAGQQLIDSVATLPADSHLLLLVSGGASALAECLPDDTSLTQWQDLTEKMLQDGYNIGQINARRKQTSLIKDGKLLRAFKGKSVQVLAISDVEGDDIATIGSGIGDIKQLNCQADLQLIATNKVARAAVATQAQALGLKVQCNFENMYQDITTVAPIIASELKTAAAGIYIWGGEPTVQLPTNPGSGGRNQSLALLLAQQIQGLDNIDILVAGTDGTDGPTDAAGGIVNGQTVTDPSIADSYLQRADAGTYLRQVDDIFITGPTNTNVMDLVIAVVS